MSSVRRAYFWSASGGVSADIALLPAKLGLYVEGRLVGLRRASASNIALGERTNYQRTSSSTSTSPPETWVLFGGPRAAVPVG